MSSSTSSENKDNRTEEEYRSKRKTYRGSSSESDSERRKKHHKKSKKSKHHHKEKKEKKYKKEKKKYSDSEDDERKYRTRSEMSKLSTADYYAKSKEFREWLLEEKKIYLEDLETHVAKEYFAKFVTQWNSGELPARIYKASDAQLEAGSRTKYQWSFVKKLDPVEMGNLRDTVFQDTNTGQRPVSQQRNELEESLGPAVGPPRPKPEGEDEELKREYEAWKIKKDKKDYKKHKELVEEELVPKKTGREATMEKKKMKAQYTKPKEADDVELKDSQIYGGSDYQRLLTKQRERNLNKQMAKMEALDKAKQEYRRKEEEKLAPFRLMLQAGTKLTASIPPNVNQ